MALVLRLAVLHTKLVVANTSLHLWLQIDIGQKSMISTSAVLL